MGTLVKVLVKRKICYGPIPNRSSIVQTNNNKRSTNLATTGFQDLTNRIIFTQFFTIIIRSSRKVGGRVRVLDESGEMVVE